MLIITERTIVDHLPLRASSRSASPAPRNLASRSSRGNRRAASLVRLTIDRLDRERRLGRARHRSDGWRASCTFAPPPEAACQALAAIPVDVSDSAVARVIVERQSGAVDTLHLLLRVSAPTAAGRPSARARAGREPSPRRPEIHATMDSVTEARIEHENELARGVGHQAQETPQLWTLPFLRPRPSRVTSLFGSGRVFNGRVSSSHLGIDYRGSVGEPIFAANRGVVALVAEFFLAGNVVYVDHGNGVVTGYFHMSQPLVAAGDTVERGQQIGLVGATGRVTGPHLHWSARFGALTIDPADLLSLGATVRRASDQGCPRCWTR